MKNKKMIISETMKVEPITIIMSFGLLPTKENGAYCPLDILEEFSRQCEDNGSITNESGNILRYVDETEDFNELDAEVYAVIFQYQSKTDNFLMEISGTKWNDDKLSFEKFGCNFVRPIPIEAYTYRVVDEPFHLFTTVKDKKNLH